MLVPEHVVWSPGLVWVLQEFGAVPRRNICAPEGIQTPILCSRLVSHPAAVFLQSACARRNDISFSTVYGHSVSFCR
jgi:hypothetical protein